MKTHSYIRTFIWFILPCLLGIVSLLFPHPTQAAGIRLGIYPPIIQIDATPPADIRHALTIKNETDAPMHLSLTLRPFTAKDTLGHVGFLDEAHLILQDKDIFQKIQVLDANNNPVNEVSLDPEEQKTLTLKIGLPKDEPPSDYYFSLVFLSTANAGNNNGSSIAGGIASNVLLSIGPKGPAHGYIEKFSAPFYITNGPVPFTVILHNMSSYYIAPQGQILIQNLFGQLIGKVDLLQQNILANSSRNLQDTRHILPDKAVWPEEILFGPYKATLTIALSREGPLFHRTIYFFALPIQYLIGLIVGIFVAVFLFFRVRTRMRQTT